LLSNDDAAALREKVKSKIESNEGSNSIQQANLANKLPDVKSIRWKMCYYKLSKLIGAYANIDRNERLNLVNILF